MSKETLNISRTENLFNAGKQQERKADSVHSVKEEPVNKRKARALKERKKTKVVQAKLYEEDYNRFLQINESRGMNTSSVIAMLITDYIRDNENLLK